MSAGLQLGLGILMGMLGIGLVLKTPWLGFGALVLLLVLMRAPLPCRVAHAGYSDTGGVERSRGHLPG